MKRTILFIAAIMLLSADTFAQSQKPGVSRPRPSTYSGMDNSGLPGTWKTSPEQRNNINQRDISDPLSNSNGMQRTNNLTPQNNASQQSLIAGGNGNDLSIPQDTSRRRRDTIRTPIPVPPVPQPVPMPDTIQR